jgi:hypothetical protein
MDKVHKPITTQYYTPSLKPFKIHGIRLSVRHAEYLGN